MKRKLSLALQDCLNGFIQWRVWLALAWQDIRVRYRRSNLGPFWITLSTAIMIYSMGLLYGRLFHLDLHTYFPYIGSGLVTWYFISTNVTDTTNAFMEGSSYIRQMKLPFTVYILRVITRNLIIFLHNFVAVIPIMVYYRINMGWHIFQLLFGLLVISACAYVYGVIFAMLGSRFRDLQQIIMSIIQVIFIATPIMWMPSMLSGKAELVYKLNPLAQLLELVRNPVMGLNPSHYAVLTSLVLIAVGFVAMILLLARARHRIVFWL